MKYQLRILFLFIAAFSSCELLLASEMYNPGKIDIHGFISQGYVDASGNHEYPAKGVADGTFEFNEMGINFSNKPSEELQIGMQLFAFDLGNLGNDEIILDWAVADYRLSDYFGLRAGLMKIPHAMYNETRDVDMLRTNIFLPISIYGEMWRDAFSRMKGAGCYGTLPGGFFYQAEFGTITSDEKGGMAQAFNAILDIQTERTETDSAYVFNLQWQTPLDGLRFVSSHYNVIGSKYYCTTGETLWPLMAMLRFAQRETDEIENISGVPAVLNFKKISANTISMEYIIGNLIFAVEYGQDPIVVDLISQETGQTIYSSDITMEAYYGSISYRFFNWLEIGTYYSELYQDKDDKDGTQYIIHPTLEPTDAWIKDLCFSARFDINENWLLKFEGHKMNGTFQVSNYHDDLSEDWEFYAAKITYNF